MAQFPHCDSEVIHRPGSCVYCDLHPELQQARIGSNTNFTGEGDPNKLPCPAEVRRGSKSINSWHGNRSSSGPHPTCPECDNEITGIVCLVCLKAALAPPEVTDDKSGSCPNCGHRGDWINLALVCPMHGRFAG